jgi:NAD-dependent dihydropyrimidine dehydrogenase PreA subunit
MNHAIHARFLLALAAALPLIGAAAGYFAGPFLARGNATVRLAWQVHREAVAHAAPTVESDAFRVSGRTAPELYAEAARLVDRFRTGSALLGAWCGLVVALKFASAARERRRTLYEIDGAACVACGRCFLSCPRERARLGLVGAGGPAQGGTDAPRP